MYLRISGIADVLPAELSGDFICKGKHCTVVN